MRYLMLALALTLPLSVCASTTAFGQFKSGEFVSLGGRLG